ncbi:MAG: ATP-binding cassette domain-containing protein [Bacteroidales bacterium]|nr:ATP-binding cassette domain-containing protein [Bacteroidales bacterium]
MLEINHITKLYGQQRAVDDVSLSINKGETVGLLGPNGAGKSTLMKILTCYIPPSSGTATVCGHSIDDDPLEVRRCIGYLPEHNPLYVDMYVREFLSFAAGIQNVKHPKQRIEELIERLGLTPEANKKISQLSKGYRQRVGLAQALIHDPQILILDEPTTGLDPNQLEEIHEVIRTVGKEKVILLSTHIMQEVTAMCNRAVIINHGRIIADHQMANISAEELTKQFHELTLE